MRTVRLSYTKKDRMRFISHLDMTRFAARIFRRANIPLWYTEGFNPHAYLTFALPLPLGFESECEMCDIKIEDDGYDIAEIPVRLNEICPPGIEFTGVWQAVNKPGIIKSADYTCVFDDGGKIADALVGFFKGETVNINKKTKRGDIKQIDVLPHIKNLSVKAENGNTVLRLNLPAGGELNINPDLIVSAFFETGKTDYYCYRFTKTAVLDKDNNNFV